jgi:hypothetical protein
MILKCLLVVDDFLLPMIEFDSWECGARAYVKVRITYIMLNYVSARNARVTRLVSTCMSALPFSSRYTFDLQRHHFFRHPHPETLQAPFHVNKSRDPHVLQPC